MQRFLGSSIFVRRNRFKETGSKFESVSIDYVDIGKSFNSINIESDFFTNYVNTENQKVFMIILDFYRKVINNVDNLFKDYVFDELYYNGKAIDRLIRLINKTNDSEYGLEDLPNIYKLKNYNEPKIHLYIVILNSSILLLLIDLYHLSIPGDLYSSHRFIKKVSLSDLSSVYNKYKNYNYNLNNILKSKE